MTKLVRALGLLHEWIDEAKGTWQEKRQSVVAEATNLDDGVSFGEIVAWFGGDLSEDAD